LIEKIVYEMRGGPMIGAEFVLQKKGSGSFWKCSSEFEYGDAYLNFPEAGDENKKTSHSDVLGTI
jgi:hypothetical protein